jgi:uncharacterized protein YabN with tetrapyrrole methylase and pyrophosphatase domain
MPRNTGKPGGEVDQNPDLILLGYGVDDTLQLTVETQRVLARAGFAFTLGLPPNLARFLKSQRVEHTELTYLFRPGRDFSECYLDVAQVVLKRAASDPPAVLLCQGSPLFLNSLNRFLVLQARERGLNVSILPGVSPFDAIVSELGLDVGAGLQVFDARRLVARGIAPNTALPLLIMQAGGFGAGANGHDPATYEPLAAFLAQFYPPQQPVTVVNTGAGGGRSTVPLSRFDELVSHIGAASSLFIDATRRSAPTAAPA